MICSVTLMKSIISKDLIHIFMKPCTEARSSVLAFLSLKYTRIYSMHAQCLLSLNDSRLTTSILCTSVCMSGYVWVCPTRDRSKGTDRRSDTRLKDTQRIRLWVDSYWGEMQIKLPQSVLVNPIVAIDFYLSSVSCNCLLSSKKRQNPPIKLTDFRVEGFKTNKQSCAPPVLLLTCPARSSRRWGRFQTLSWVSMQADCGTQTPWSCNRKQPWEFGSWAKCEQLHVIIRE